MVRLEEYAFCALLARLETCWHAVDAPMLADRFAAVEPFADDLWRFGPADFLYSDGDALFVHGDRRRQADGSLALPGHHVLHRECTEGSPFETSGPEIIGPNQRVVVVWKPWSMERLGLVWNNIEPRS